MNPILAPQYFVPDVEARQWTDGRVYLYGSYDINGGTTFCSYEYRVFSSADLINWQDHGESFRSTAPRSGVPWIEEPLYAPDCVHHAGKYHLFFCLAGGGEGVAESLTPQGPFRGAVPVEGANGDGIDPAALVDDDGQVYYYWGQHQLRGARLRSDLRAIDSASLRTHLLTEEADGFHEGASIRKRNGIYYLVYADIASGRPTRLSYATSRQPLGPFEKRGTIVDNVGCDRESWNNHGSIAEINGAWYVFYHRSSQSSIYNRRVCVEPIQFDDEGRIAEVEMTTQGVSPPLQATAELEAWRACLLSGQVRTASVGPSQTGAWSEHLTSIHDNDWAAFKYVDFGAGVHSLEVQAASLAYGGTLEIRIDAPHGLLMGACEIGHTGGWQSFRTFSAPVTGAVGIHAVFLVFRGRGGRLFDLKSFKFCRLA